MLSLLHLQGTSNNTSFAFPGECLHVEFLPEFVSVLMVLLDPLSELVDVHILVYAWMHLPHFSSLCALEMVFWGKTGQRHVWEE